MPEIFVTPFESGLSANPWDIFLRLVVALLLGGVVAWVYVRTSEPNPTGSTFPTTLILMSVLIAMVTQVIGDNVALAFSLVGALSIVRFRTVVRDTKDTAYVIFAVVVGMAVGAQNFWVATIGIVVAGAAAFVMASHTGTLGAGETLYQLSIRLGLGHDFDTVAGKVLDEHLEGRQLVSIATARQGMSMNFVVEGRLRKGRSSEGMVKELNRIEGVQDVRLRRRGFENI
jgi:hypothetical protein